MNGNDYTCVVYAHTSVRLFGWAASHLAYQHLPPYDIQ